MQENERETMLELAYSQDYKQFEQFIQGLLTQHFGLCMNEPEQVTVQHTFQHAPALNFCQISFEINFYGSPVFALQYDADEFGQFVEQDPKGLYQACYNTVYQEIMARKRELT